ncbi:MAG: glycoside hydrolase family 2 immunoglobulin protein beta-sandwich, partial [Armatimonadetes bacterium]|nr:glycoside hydrolase family 2 immunoglobulin protein beta-sandwich [Armatimonadota bacterium]
MRTTLLHSGWSFLHLDPGPGYPQPNVQRQRWLPASVPGHVHLDLMANGVIQDPFVRLGELGCRWVDEADWAYRTTFHWTPDPSLPRRVLQFEGLDTVCEVSLNGERIAAHDSMFLPLEVDVTDRLREGENELRIDFRSPVQVGQERRAAYFAAEGLPNVLERFDERAFVRKAGYMSAWDWGPRLLSCGIWRPVALVEYAARIRSFTVRQEPLPDGRFRVWTETVVDGDAEVTLTFGEHSASSSSTALQELDLVLDEARLWWPNGMGEQHLYPASVRLGNGQEVRKRIGLKTIALRREADEFGESFEFVVNGRPLWARGANWIPNDSFPSRVTVRDYHAQIADCRALGFNMLRVWGGGFYEAEPFYDACDEAGILVWQDFPYACCYYPDGPAEQEVARAEAAHHVRRLRDRASLALWCGNNENHQMWQEKWGVPTDHPPRYYGEPIYEAVLPGVVAELDPGRPYIPSSPIGIPPTGPQAGKVNSGGYGDSHYWDVWHGRGDWRFYLDSDARFSSEFGFASSCSLALWDRTLVPGDREFEGPIVRWHDKTKKAWETCRGYVTDHYPEPQTLEDWVYYSQLNQRDALRCGIEHYRRGEFCKGSLIWQFNDCWPVESWAVQDYRRLLKPAGYELARLYADRLVSLVGAEGEEAVHVVNDGATEL